MFVGEVLDLRRARVDYPCFYDLKEIILCDDGLDRPMLNLKTTAVYLRMWGDGGTDGVYMVGAWVIDNRHV